ncbi:unnamed protein product [Paramecium sonneborni]|uniref:Uncharacterized protein n=1 Tax=Paramecium sonneborni TaxID=65129 RepID=A0A8S1MNK3_9CILI|nr:unnamed protein product [Paramecium sonneborni]
MINTKIITIFKFQSYYQLHNLSTLLTFTQKLTQTICQIQEIENPFYETLLKNEHPRIETKFYNKNNQIIIATTYSLILN